jgi:DNA-binding NarL/FixJ family response regulator
MASQSFKPDPEVNQSPPQVRILVVDDFEPWRRSVCSMLARHPEWRVVGEAEDGVEAIQKAQTLEPEVILLDLGLPKLNGIEAAKEIRTIVPDTKILFLTAVNDLDLVRAALDTGAQGYVLKTDATTELLPALAGILRGADFVSSGIKSGYCTDTKRA